MEVFRSGGDIYCASASQMFHVPVEKHGQNSELRQRGKVATLALGYGGGEGALINMGASAVLADSFARIFFRNGINLGLPLIVCKGIAKHVQDGQTISLDILSGKVTIEETGEVLQAEALGDKAMEILSAGGIKPMMRARFGK